jgi:hypothetical protein
VTHITALTAGLPFDLVGVGCVRRASPHAAFDRAFTDPIGGAPWGHSNREKAVARRAARRSEGMALIASSSGSYAPSCATGRAAASDGGGR